MKKMTKLLVVASALSMLCIAPMTWAAQGKAKSKNPKVTIVTSEGKIVVELFPSRAPETVKNFLELAKGTKTWTDPNGNPMKTPLYNGTKFHRVIPDFMIQGGDPAGNGTGGPGYTFKDEFTEEDKFDKPGILAMANSGPGTNGSQFFITVKETPWLAKRHTIFGKVADEKSLKVVMKISTVQRDQMDAPLKPVVIQEIKAGS